MVGLDPLQRPSALRPGDRIGVFVAASPVREPWRSRGLEALRAMGYQPVEVPDILSSRDFTAKDPQAVLADLNAFFADSRIRGLWAARGGYGANLLLPILNGLQIPAPKVVVASSDLSVLLWWLLERRRMVVFYGPMAYASLAEGLADPDQCRRQLDGSDPRPGYSGRPLIPGRARARLTGGCLTNLVSLLGTPWFPPLKNRILLLEDVSERPYRLHRMFWQLVSSGALAGVRGIALGEFPGCFQAPGERESLMQRLAEMLSPLEIPVMTDLPLGHARRARLIPLGITVEMAVDREARLLPRESGTMPSAADR